MNVIPQNTGGMRNGHPLDECLTPNTNEQPLVNIVQKVLGGTIHLDPCSNKEKSIPAQQHFTVEEDGLSEQWMAESVYMFPPPSEARAWVQKLCYHYKNGDIARAIAVLEATQMSSKSVGSLIEKCASCIAFWGAGKARALSFPSAVLGAVSYVEADMVLIYLGDPPNKFVSELTIFTSIYVPFF